MRWLWLVGLSVPPVLITAACTAFSGSDSSAASVPDASSSDAEALSDGGGSSVTDAPPPTGFDAGLGDCTDLTGPAGGAFTVSPPLMATASGVTLDLTLDNQFVAGSFLHPGNFTKTTVFLEGQLQTNGPVVWPSGAAYEDLLLVAVKAQSGGTQLGGVGLILAQAGLNVNGYPDGVSVSGDGLVPPLPTTKGHISVTMNWVTGVVDLDFFGRTAHATRTIIDDGGSPRGAVDVRIGGGVSTDANKPKYALVVTSACVKNE